MLKKALIISFLILALLTRFAFLDRVPSGVSNDELDYILNAKSIFISGSDISHTWNPISLTTPKSSFPQAEIPPLLTFFVIGPLPLSLFYSKIPYAIYSVLLVVVIYFLTKKLIGEKEAIAVGLLASINPWLIFFGRSAYDTSLSLFFFLLGWLALLYLKKWKIILVFPLFFIGFYSYIGFKLLLVPFSLITIFYSWHVISKKKYTKEYLTLFLLCLGLFSVFTFQAFHSKGQRTNEISSPNMASIVSKTNNERRLSIYTPLTYVFSNKYTIFLKDSLDTYLNAFSPDLLFIHGDNKYLFSVYQHGVFYLIDFLFILIGFGSLFAKNKKVLLLLGSLTLISPLPSVVSNLGISYAIRSMLLAPLLCIFGGVGIWETINFTKKKYKTFISLLIVLIYFLSFLNFLNIYLFRNPIYNSESFSFSSRILVKYLSFTTKPVYVVDLNPRTPLKQYLFYTNSLKNKNKDTIANSFLTKDYRLNNIVFLNCKDLKNIKQNSVIVTNDLKCKNLPITSNYLNIVQLSDSGTIYKIYNDNICSNFSLSKYVANIKLSDLNVEDLSKEDFCQKFIIKF